MNPNNQSREFEQDNQPTPEAEFGTPNQPSTQDTPSVPSFSLDPEPIPTMSPTPSSEPQPFGQAVTPGQPPVPQPAFPSPEVPPVGQPMAAPHVENPGQTLGIISIILSFVGLSVVGIILGVISRKQSKAVGASTTLGTVGMVIGIVVTALVVLMILPIFILSILIAASGDIETTTDNSGISRMEESLNSSELANNASVVAEKAEAYKTKAGDYPEYGSDFDKYPESTIHPDLTYYTMLVTNNAVTYLYCEPGAAQVVYYEDAAGTKLNITPLGTASSAVSCAEIQQ